MAVISIVATDTGDLRQNWSLPDEEALFTSPIPRGLRKYIGALAVAALGASDESDVNITFTFPTNFIYLPKSMNLHFRSDDGTESFDVPGIWQYNFTAATPLGSGPSYAMTSLAAFLDTGGAVMLAQRIWSPVGSWRHFIDAPNGDSITMRVSDTTPTSTAGDMRWYAEFWEYDVEQWFNWQIELQSQQHTYGPA